MPSIPPGGPIECGHSGGEWCGGRRIFPRFVVSPCVPHTLDGGKQGATCKMLNQRESSPKGRAEIRHLTTFGMSVPAARPEVRSLLGNRPGDALVFETKPPRRRVATRMACSGDGGPATARRAQPISAAHRATGG